MTEIVAGTIASSDEAPTTAASTMPAGRVRTARCEIRSVARNGATAQAAGTVSRNTRHSPRCRRLSPSHASGEGPPKALTDRNVLATPPTLNRFSVATRQWQRPGIGRWVTPVLHCEQNYGD